MAKLTLTDLASSQASSILSTVNANNALIEAALEKTLSRDGTSPNSMEDTLDMNSERIVNLPAPVSPTEPIRKGEWDPYLDAMDETLAASVAAVQALDDFTDLWLGIFSSDPTVDNDGDPLQEGALYFNSATNRIKVYSTGVWSTPLSGTVVASSEIDVTPSGADVSLSLKAGSIDETKLDASTNASLDLADSASQPGHTHTSGSVTDFTEAAQDAVGAMVDSTLVYTDATPLLVRAALTGAITASAGSNTTSLGSFTLAQLNTAVSDANIQPLDATLTALAAYNTTGFIVQTAADTFAGRSLAAPAAGLTITNPAGTAGNPTFALANDLAALEALSGTNTMYYRSATDTWTAVTIGGLLSFSGGTLNVGDAELTALAGLTSAADRLPYFTGSGTAALATYTSFARSLDDDADAATARTTLGAQAAVQFKDEGSNVGTSGAITSIDFVGTGVTASAVGTALTVTISGGGGGGLTDTDYGDITVSGGGAVMTIDNDVVTYAKMQNAAANTVIARAAATSGDLSEVALSASQFIGRGSTGNVAALAPDASTIEFSGTTLRVKDAGITPAKLSGGQSGSAPAYAARAWINFNGTGTPAARASGNVSSITDNAAGSWDINFTTAMADTNYSTQVSGGYYATDTGRSFAQVGPRANVSTGSVRVYQQSSTTGNTRQDVDEYNVVIFR